MLFILCTLLLALKRLWQALESWHLKVGDGFLSIAAWTVRLQLENDEQKEYKRCKNVVAATPHKSITKQQTNKHNNRTTYVYKKWLPPIIPRSDTFLSEVHSYHTFCTHLQSKCSRHIKNKYIYTEKKKIWINNFIDKKKTSTPKFKHSERNKTVVYKQYELVLLSALRTQRFEFSSNAGH